MRRDKDIGKRPGKKDRPLLAAGVDIGNATTEAAVAVLADDGPVYKGSGMSQTTGIKGTCRNTAGIMSALAAALTASGHSLTDLDLICLNDAVPVMGDLSMSTISETVITESTMIGHDPSTPGGAGLGSGVTVPFSHLPHCTAAEQVIPVIPRRVSFEAAAEAINTAIARGIKVQGAVVQNNDGVLIANRIAGQIPIVDEVGRIEAVPLHMPAVVEVAPPGRRISRLCNPYGIAALLDLSPEETKKIAPVAVALIGNRSAVVIKTPTGDIAQRRIPAGKLTILGRRYDCRVDITEGAEKMMAAVERLQPLKNVFGEPGSAVGGMLSGIRRKLGRATGQSPDGISVGDIFGVDAVVPQKIAGGIADEIRLNKGIALAAMVETDKSMTAALVRRLEKMLPASIVVAGLETHSSLLGAATTPGVDRRLVVVDMGAGSVDAARFDRSGDIRSVHLAGAGDLTTLLIDSRLGLSDRGLAEAVKKCPAARVNDLFQIVLEDGSRRVFDKPLSGRLFGKTVLLPPEGEMLPLPRRIRLEQLSAVRKDAKKKVFVPNVIRALKRILPGGNLRSIENVVLIGGCAEDFELPEMLSEVLLNDFGIICGSGNIRGRMGPRNAVATGLIISFDRQRRKKHAHL